MKGQAIPYTEQELAWIKRNCTKPRKEAHEAFCKKFGRSDVSMVNLHALCKRKGWFTGRTGRFEKDHIPANLGKKMPYNANNARTQFKKGRVPHNTNYLGHERVSKDGYVEISIAETNPHTGFERRYVLKHRHLWEQANGKLPDDMCLKCLNGDRTNTDPSNWEAIPRATLPYLNGHRGFDYANSSPEVRPAIITFAKLKHASRQALKGQQHDK